MYDMQIKKKLFLFAVRALHISLTQKRVLDIGFGSGDILFAFDPTCEIYGLDVSPYAVERATRQAAKRGYRRASFLQCDLDQQTLPFHGSSFDLIVCSHVLEHLVDDVAVLAEVRRLLRPGGIAVILIPINEKAGEDPHHVRVYNASGFRAELERTGLGPVFVFESEYVWHVVGWFFARGYHERMPLIGRMMSGLINVPLALLPFRAHLLLDRIFHSLGYAPRQAILCARRRDAYIEAGGEASVR